MKPRSHRKLLCCPLLGWTALVTVGAAGLISAAGGTDPSGLATREVEALRARILELEKATGAAGAAVVSTNAAREAGANARVGAGDAARVKALIDLIQRRDAPALTKELGSLLARGEPAYATLFDFLSELDRDSRQAFLLTYDYHFSFSLVHVVMLHEDEFAKFAHYFLAATKSAPLSTLRRTIFDFLPDFLLYHRGRYPDLERNIEEEILRRLKERKGDLRMYYGAMESLGYKPPVEVFDPLLEAASSHAETLPVVLHLQARNDSAAVGILSRNVARNPPGNEWKSSIMLDSLARMSSPDASRALLHFVDATDDKLRSAAVQAYFAVPRDKSSLPMVQEFLDSNIDLKEKRLLIRRMHQQQSAIFEALKAGSDELRSEDVKEMLKNESLQPAR